MSDINVTVVGVTGVSASVASNNTVSVTAGSTAGSVLVTSAGVVNTGGGATALLVEAGANITVTTTQGSFTIIGQNVPVLSVNGKTGTVVLTAADIGGLTAVANVTSVNGKTGGVTLVSTDVSAASASHSHVVADISNFTSVANVTSVNGKTGGVTLVSTDVSAASASHSHVAADVTNLTAVANVVSVNGITGTPTIVAGANVTVSTSGTAITITAAAGGGTSGGSVTSVNGQTGVVVLTATDVTAAAASHSHVATDITNLTAVANVISVNGRTGAVSLVAADVTAASASHGHSYVTSLNGNTGTLSIVAGSNVTVSTSGATIVVDGSAGTTLSDALPLALGTAAAGDDTQAARADHSHPMPTAADVGALDVDATVDGGDYVGVIIQPGGSITISSQPASQTVTAGGVNEIQSTLPAGTWRSVSYVDSKWFVMGFSNTSADYYAVSSDGGASWTKRYGLPSAGLWSAMQFENGVYATNAGNTTAYSSDALTWSAYTSTSVFGTSAVLGAGGKFLRFASGGLNHSTDAANWTKSLDWSGTGKLHFGYASNTYFASITQTAIRASADGVTWGSAFALGSSTGVSPQAYGDFLTPVEFGGSLYFSRQNYAPLKYTSGTWGGVPNPAGTGGGQVASNGSVLVLYSYTGAIYSSTNGTTWVQRLTGLGSQNTYTLFHAGGRFVLLYRYGSGGSTPGTAYYTSTDGIEWTAATRTYGTANAVDAATVSGSTHASHQNGIFSAITFGGTTASATFGVVATYTSPLSYQWQVSLDAGSTWSNITDATASTLVLTGLTSADSGKRYRCVLSAVGASTVNSNSAILTVN